MFTSIKGLISAEIAALQGRASTVDLGHWRLPSLLMELGCYRQSLRSSRANRSALPSWSGTALTIPEDCRLIPHAWKELGRA